MGASDDISPARASRLKTGEQDAVARIGGQRLQVVQHPTTGGHATGGNDHRRLAQLVKVAGLIDRADDPCALAHRRTLRRQ
ncbi:hypothetical protein D3C80_889950 [compost metagenome]